MTKEDGIEHGRQDLPLKENGKRWNLRTEYHPRYIDLLLSMMRDGATYNEVAREIGVSVATLRNWRDNFPEFAEAMEAGFDWAQGWFEMQGREYLISESNKDGPSYRFDTKLYIFTMSTRFKVSDKVPTINLGLGEDTKDMDVDKTIKIVKRLHSELI